MSDHEHLPLRLWLRLLTCTKLIETHVSRQLRSEFEMTLPRFDLLAQLYRHPNGLRMGELSHLLMVTGTNVTAVTDKLERDGLVERIMPPEDRRTILVRLTDTGRADFEEMAREHKILIAELMSGMSDTEMAALYELLSLLKQHLQEKTVK